MSESSDTLPALGRLTPDLAGEVRRNLIVWLAVMVAVAAVFSGLFAIAVDPFRAPLAMAFVRLVISCSNSANRDF